MHMDSGFLSKKKEIFSCLSFCTHETYPSCTSKDDDKGTEKDPETNAHRRRIDKLEMSGVTSTYLTIVISRPLRWNTQNDG